MKIVSGTIGKMGTQAHGEPVHNISQEVLGRMRHLPQVLDGLVLPMAVIVKLEHQEIAAQLMQMLQVRTCRRLPVVNQ